MTKLDRAVIDEEELLELSQFYRSLNISASELYKILKKVKMRANYLQNRHSNNSVNIVTDSTRLLRYDYGL